MLPDRRLCRPPVHVRAVIDERLRETLLALKTLPDVEIDVPGFKGALEAHQKVAVMFGTLAGRCLFVDQVGLGKTVEAIGTDLKLRSLGRVHKTLVLAQSGKRFDWHAEYERFSDLSVVVIGGPKSVRNTKWLNGQCADVTIASYEATRLDLLDKQVLPDQLKTKFYVPSGLLGMLKYDLLIFDEVTFFKTWGTVLNLALGYLVQQAGNAYAIGLSATPIQKSVEDFYSIVDKVFPGYLGTKVWFDHTFLIKRRINGVLRTVGAQNESVLRHGIAPIFIRRERDQVYPGRTVYRSKVRRVCLTSNQIRLYDDIVNATPPNADMGALLKRFELLEKVVDTTAWFDGQGDDSAKIDDLAVLLDELEGEKLVIFSKHLKMLDETARKVLVPRKIEHIFYTGRERDIEQREAGRKRFLEDPSCRIALISTAAEMGYNFHSAHTIIFLNHVYNPARTAQIRGRIDRPIVQQSSLLLSIHYVAAGTFEDKLIGRLQKEAQLSTTLLGATNEFDQLDKDLVDEMSRDNLFNLIRQGRAPDRE